MALELGVGFALLGVKEFMYDNMWAGARLSNSIRVTPCRSKKREKSKVEKVCVHDLYS
jgi:hypothetical protein